MESAADLFPQKSRAALLDANLQKAVTRTVTNLRTRRAAALDAFAEYGTTRAAARAIKDHTIRHLDHYLEQFEAAARRSGARVHWAETGADAARIALEICRNRGARTITRVKSMLGEEIGLPDVLDRAGLERIETDLAEHINQLAGDSPSHIVIPAMHKTREEVADLFEARHAHHRYIDHIPELVESARIELRDRYFKADVGISGANFLVAGTGSVCTVTNEGNAELTVGLPKVHIVTAGIEKLVPTMEHCFVLLRLLARAALGQEITQYTTFFNGPRRQDESDGPEEFHIILVDNRRTELLGGPLEPMLRCIRCAACINHCPVYGAIGGHAYGSVYQGPMGSVLTPALDSLDRAKHLPQACTLNGRCAEVCPVDIPLPDLLRHLRGRVWAQRLAKGPGRLGIALWGWAAARPWAYRLALGIGLRAASIWPGAKGRLNRMPLADGWTRTRDLARPAPKSFMALYRRRGGRS